MILSPSLLSADFGNLEQVLKDLEKAELGTLGRDGRFICA